MRYVRVKVKRDAQTAYSRSMPLWEIPVLEFIFEPGNVEVEDVFEKVSHPYPDAPAEFDRLVRAYGTDSENNIPYVASVYGNGSLGMRALKRVIDQAKMEDAVAARAEKARAARTVVPVEEFEGDPLLA